MSIIPIITSDSVTSDEKVNGNAIATSLQNGSCLSHSSSLPMIAYELSDDSSFHDGTPMRESAFGSSKTTSLEAVGSDVSIHLPGSATFAFPATSSQLNSRSYQHSKRRSAQRRSSNSSIHSETRTNLILQNVGRTIQRTHNHLRRTRLLHAFYLLALPVYTLLGALIFQALDGEHDDFMKRDYERRCQHLRDERLETLRNECIFAPDACFNMMRNYLEEVENCYRAWHDVNRTVTHPMSDFTNAIVYAFSVYTTIGYGNMAADTMGCRVATVIYGALGIPLFFAFIKEEGNLFRLCFIWIYKFIQKIHVRSCHLFVLGRSSTRSRHRRDTANLTGTVAVLVGRTQDLVGRNPNVPFIRKLSTGSLFGTKGRHTTTSEQRRVFIAGVAVFIVYLLAISGVFAMMTDWDYFTAFYFLFNSVALIGFGDIFPAEPKIILVNTFFIVMGVVLFSMCYFILQEEIREKAFEASRRARMSISKYSHTLMQHTKNPWSRRNSPAFDSSGSPDPNSFDKLRKRRQSAPAVSLTVPPFTLSPRSRSPK